MKSFRNGHAQVNKPQMISEALFIDKEDIQPRSAIQPNAILPRIFINIVKINNVLRLTTILMNKKFKVNNNIPLLLTILLTIMLLN